MFKTAVGASVALAVAAAGSAAAEARTYVVDAARSQVVVHVGRAGLFKFAGHEHEVLAPRFAGEIQADAGDLKAGSVRLGFEVGALQVSGRGEPPEDVPKVQAKMVGPELLDAARFPLVAFRSTSVDGREASKGSYELRVAGELSLHGVTRPITVPVRVEVSTDKLVAAGNLALRHTDYGLTPVSVAGVVKVKNEVSIDFRIEATALPATTRDMRRP